MLARVLASHNNVLCAAALHVLLLGWGITSHSPVVDEVGYLSAGIIHWTTGDFRPYQVNPPLVRSIAVAPVLPLLGKVPVPRSRPIWPGDRPEFRDGAEFIRVFGERSLLMIRLARGMCVPFSLLALAIVWRWSLELYGPVAGSAAAWLWCCSPLILGHGALMTPDVPAAAMVVTSMFVLRRWAKLPSVQLAVALGLLLGLALGVKYTSLLTLPIVAATGVAVLATCPHWLTRLQRAGQLILALLLATMVINCAYRFQGSLLPAGQYVFVSSAFTGEAARPSEFATGNRLRGTWMAPIPVPLPREYVTGIDLQQRDFEAKLRSYLGGEWRHGGWWYYYLYAFCVKLPIGTLLLLLCAGLASAKYGRLSNGEVFLLAPAVLIVATASVKCGFSHHFRYVLPAMPFLLIFCSKAVRYASSGRVLAMISRCAVAASVGASLMIAPHWLSFFNIMVGGPAYGGYHLLSSNIDWGQDLLFLRDWAEDRKLRAPIALGYCGLCDAAVYGINAVPAGDVCGDGMTASRYLAVSVNLLHGGTSAMRLNGRVFHIGGDQFTCLREVTPVGRAGYSILIFDRQQLGED